MADEHEKDPAEELREMIQRMLGGEGELDLQSLANAAGMQGGNADAFAGLMQHLQSALSNPSEEIDWSAGVKQAQRVVQQNPGSVSAEDREATQQAAHLAALWLDEQTQLGTVDRIEHLSRQQWAEATFPVWQEMSEPVAASIAKALTDAMSEMTPESEADMVQGAGRLLRSVGGTLFAVQLGQVVGQLAGEVLSGGDIGFPLLDDRAAVITANLPQLTDGLEVPDDQTRIWLALRELAHARLFHHAKWLRLEVMSEVRSYAEGIHVDVRALDDLAMQVDPSNPEQIQELLRNGSLIPPRTREQEEALASLETTLALIEGWVDCVTQQAAARLPKQAAIAEAVRRRRATGGPAEKALSTLVGLEIRPRRLREASEFWQRITAEVGAEKRDSLWESFDLVPTAEDIDDPSRIIAQLKGESTDLDEIDIALRQLFDEEAGDAAEESHESSDVTDSASGSSDGDEGDEAPDDSQEGEPKTE
ncbi:MAG TPA: zinc-dependent metalloprotease [Candidatus Agrococcus pullicola]|uniref:Zinc-dependent metalloprotease n=1 Tax=Candidatus Agrococcus pullicola TaxID=2838429 RepID=A0A9D2CA54_9MICO|nr:zinc-dependent metalloprotease [Candidatus Agrococcus pullicola]